MNDLERFHACMSYHPVDRLPWWNWGAWPETIERWQREGYDPAVYEPALLADPRNSIHDWFFPSPPFEHTVIEEDETFITYINHEGILMKERKDQPFSSMPQFLKFPVETPQEFRAFWAERMQPDLTKRVGPDWSQRLRMLRSQPMPLIIVSDRWGGFFGPQRNLTGVQNLCTLFYDDPVFIEEMMDANADFIIAIMDQLLDVVEIDAFAFWEDMAYKAGPLLSPRLARQYMLPRYRRVVDFLNGRGVRYIGVDSDGLIDELIPIWLDAGLNFIYPFEVQAGMDVLQVRRKWGKELRLWGGYDKRALAIGREAIDAEMQRLRPLMLEGGFIPHTDHTCPPDISFENYCYFMQRMHEITNV
jgi:uroporphyrinogen decarboxylase